MCAPNFMLKVFMLEVALIMGLAIPATAQQSAGTFFTGVNPRNITMVPIDTNKAMQNLNINKAFRTPAQTKAFSLSNVFPGVHLGSWPPIIANTPILGQKNNPYQPNPIFGKNPFQQTPSK